MQGFGSVPGRAYALGCAVLLVGGLLPSIAPAQSMNLLANGGNPVLYDAGFLLPSSCAQSTPQASVVLRNVGGDELEIDVDNKSACRANYFLSLPLQGGGFNTNVANQPTGTKFILSGRFKVVTGNTKFVRGTLGFSAALQGQGYGGGETVFNEFSTNAYQDVSHVYVAGVPDASGQPIQGTIVAQVVTPDVAPGERLIMRLRNLSMVKKDAATRVEVNALLKRVQLAGAGKPIKLSIPVTPIPLSGPMTKSLSLVDPLEVTRHTFPLRSVSYLGPNSWTGVLDTWSEQLPATLPEGRYSIRYALSLSGSQIQAGAGVVTHGPASAPSYEVGTLVVDNKAGMYVGQHFHRYPGNNQGMPIQVPYQLVRSLNHDGVVELGWWQSSGIQFGAIDNWAKFHAGQDSAPVKKLLFTFFGSPQWLSSQPNLPNDYNNPNMLGMWASPSDLGQYSQMVTAVVNRHKARIAAVECWNEPDLAFAGAGGATTVPLNDQLADICKAIHVATKAVDASIVTICPQASKPEAMGYWLSGKTSANEPITNYCDMVGAHTYQRVGVDATGAPYSRQLNLVQSIQDMKKALVELGLDKPLAITEMGFQDDVSAMWMDNLRFSDKSGDKRGEVIYETLATARELGVRLFGLYSYDGGYKNGVVTREPWEPCPAPSDRCYGLEGLATTDASDRNQVIGKITAATNDLGVTSSNGVPLQRLNLFMVPSTTAVNADGDVNVKFHITVSNPGLTHAKGVAVSTNPTSTMYVSSSGNSTGFPSTSIFALESLTPVNGAGSCALAAVQVPTENGNTQQVNQWTCSGLTVRAGDALVLEAAGRVVPSMAQRTYMGWPTYYKYRFQQVLTVSWQGRAVPIPALTSNLIVVSR